MNDPSKKMSGEKQDAIRGKMAFLPSLKKRALSHKFAKERPGLRRNCAAGA
jgi:hypothetical protein